MPVSSPSSWCSSTSARAISEPAGHQPLRLPVRCALASSCSPSVSISTISGSSAGRAACVWPPPVSTPPYARRLANPMTAGPKRCCWVRVMQAGWAWASDGSAIPQCWKTSGSSQRLMSARSCALSSGGMTAPSCMKSPRRTAVRPAFPVASRTSGRVLRLPRPRGRHRTAPRRLPGSSGTGPGSWRPAWRF